MIFRKDSTARSWAPGAEGSDFPLQNLPYGVFHRAGESPRVGVAIGDLVLDLAQVHDAGLFDDISIAQENVFDRRQLNDFMASGQATWREVRTRLVALLADGDVEDADGVRVAADGRLARDSELCKKVFVARGDVTMVMPCWVGAFVDFYASREHATRVGTMFRDPENPLLPNWLHLPVGYHGRGSSVVVSGTDIRRPCGQVKPNDAATPTFGPSQALDFELEMGFFTGPGNKLGERIDIADAAEHIFGMVLVNDWSARDIQKWEYVPLGPFLGKSFATSISPWVVPMDALAPFRVQPPAQEPAPLPHLATNTPWGLDVELEVELQIPDADPLPLVTSNARSLYWTIAQQLAHASSNGTNIEPGDLYATGTISGSASESRGCLLEITSGGSEPITLPGGASRIYLDDGDTVIMQGRCLADRFRVGFGDVRGRILPAH